MDKIEQLKELLKTIRQQSQDIIDLADTEERSLTDEESERLEKLNADFEAARKDLERREMLLRQAEALETSAGRETTPEDRPATNATRSGTRIETGRDLRFDNDRWGWSNLGEFALGVRSAAARGGGAVIDKRLEIRAPTTVSTEGALADGGAAVPPQWRNEIMTLVAGEDSLLGRTDQQVSSSNTFVAPKDETTAWQTTGGVLAYWEGENDQGTQSKVALEQNNVRLNKLMVLVPVTDELAEDAPSLDAYLRRKAPEKISFKINLAIVQGNGVGQPLGILNGGSVVSVAKEGSQTADTVNFENVTKMWARCYAPSRRNAVWLINQDIEQQLMKLTVEGTSSSTPAFLPAGGLSGSPYATLMGRPMIPTQACETLGDLGDIILADLSQYLSVTKSGGLRSETSIHLWFDYDVLAYRFVMRVGGQPWWGSTISPRDGSNTLSPFVSLAERA